MTAAAAFVLACLLLGKLLLLLAGDVTLAAVLMGIRGHKKVPLHIRIFGGTLCVTIILFTAGPLYDTALQIGHLFWAIRNY